MMDQHDAAEALAAEIGQQRLGLGDLRLAQVAGGEKGGLGTPLDRPTSATGPRRRKVGKTSKSRAGGWPSPAM